MSQKSYNNEPTLYLIPTPIGNMDDITLRSIKVLNEVEVVFCEDTRVTGILLKHLNIKKKLISNHKYNEEKNHNKLLQYLNEGYSVGLVSDRGTPIISDPGYELARFAIQNNFNVVSLPGATAFVPALTSSGISPMPFLFYGFLNNKEGKRKKELISLKDKSATLIFYEAPHRIEKTLENILEVMGDRNISISREISKKFEEIYRGKISEVVKQIIDIKGEIVIVLEGKNKEEMPDNLTVIEHINNYIEDGYSSKDAIKLVAKERGLGKNEVYKIYHGGD